MGVDIVAGAVDYYRVFCRIVKNRDGCRGGDGMDEVARRAGPFFHSSLVRLAIRCFDSVLLNLDLSSRKDCAAMTRLASRLSTIES